MHVFYRSTLFTLAGYSINDNRRLSEELRTTRVLMLSVRSSEDTNLSLLTKDYEDSS